MRNRLPIVLISSLLLSIVLLAGCTNDEEFHMKLRLLDQEMIKSKLEQEGLTLEEKELPEVYRLDAEGLRSQTAYGVAGPESSLFVYIFGSEEEQVLGRKELERQTIALSYKPAYYDVNNVLLLYLDGDQDDPYKTQFDDLARILLKK